MMRRIVVLGGGMGGTLTANRLHNLIDPYMAEIVIVDQDDNHVYQPGLLLVPFGMVRRDQLIKTRHRQFKPGIIFHRSAIDRVDPANCEVHLSDGATFGYDVLVVATGAALLPGKTRGLTGPGWLEKIFTFYDLDGAMALSSALNAFGGGRLVVNVADLPIKGPVAPLEFSFLADWYFRRRGIRDKVHITLATPMPAAFTKPVASRELSGLLQAKGIELVTEFTTGEVDGRAGLVRSFDGRDVAFDLAVVVPPHGGAAYVGRSPGLGGELGFVPTDERTLQSKEWPNIFVVGDAGDIPAAKAGSVAHFEGEIIARNIGRFLAAEPLDAAFDGHTNSFIESGFRKALLIDFNYDTQPLAGHFPRRLGLPLLRESRVNHVGKLMLRPFYWHGLLPGRDIPGVMSKMPVAGKQLKP